MSTCALIFMSTPALIAVVTISLLFVGLALWSILSSKPAPPAAEEDTDDSWVAPEPVGYPARVVELRIDDNSARSRTYKPTFTAVFLTDDGERLTYEVPEDVYVSLSEDQTGTLVILNGKFFDFGDGEDIVEEE